MFSQGTHRFASPQGANPMGDMSAPSQSGEDQGGRAASSVFSQLAMPSRLEELSSVSERTTSSGGAAGAAAISATPLAIAETDDASSMCKSCRRHRSNCAISWAGSLYHQPISRLDTGDTCTVTLQGFHVDWGDFQIFPVK